MVRIEREILYSQHASVPTRMILYSQRKSKKTVGNEDYGGEYDIGKFNRGCV